MVVCYGDVFPSQLQVSSNKAEELISSVGSESCALTAPPQEFSIHKLHSLSYTSIQIANAIAFVSSLFLTSDPLLHKWLGTFSPSLEIYIQETWRVLVLCFKYLGVLEQNCSLKNAQFNKSHLSIENLILYLDRFVWAKLLWNEKDIWHW